MLSVQNEFVSNTWNYLWGADRLLVVSFDRNNILDGIRVIDRTFNADGLLTAKNQNVGLGSTSRDLERTLRERPIDVDPHITCPSDLQDGRAYSWKFNGILYSVCGGNDTVLWIDIP